MSGEPKKDVLRETDADARALASDLVRTARFGALAAIEPGTGHPMASRVAVATMLDATPIILISALSGHTPAILADPRCSLLVGEPGKGDPLAHPRITLFCDAEKLERGGAAQIEAARRYANRHPKAKLYADFADFSYFLLHPRRASLNGGFGKAYALERADLVADFAANAALQASEQGALEHMNSDHADAVSLYASHFARAEGEGWRITGIDAGGLDIAAGDASRRVNFPAPLTSADALRVMLVEMAREARSASES